MADPADSPSPSTRLPPKHVHALNHATPAHTPQNSQHSLRSSTSSRAPLHTLSLHEYRKLQNTPPPQSATPPGKPLRRKPAAAALNGLDRTPSVRRTPTVKPTPVAQLRHLSSRPLPLHLSQSADQLTPGHQPLPPSPPYFGEQTALLDRSQSAEPSEPTRSKFGSQKVSNWNPIKRLPKPKSAIPSPHPPLPSGATFSPPLRATPTSPTENVSSSGTGATPSTFSLSRFPKPPNLADPASFRSNDKNALPLVNTSFSTIAPATPPATPAVIHYRGASFDLLNPHDSLLFHDIETPSRDLDSSEYLPLRTSEEPHTHYDMARRRPLYTDLPAAYTSIRHREDSPGTPGSEGLVPPAPALLSPESSSYSSPENPYEFRLRVSPLAIRKSPTDSRFSLKDMTSMKQLGDMTRSFTKKLSKSAEPTELELQPVSPSSASPAIGQFEGNYPRPLDQSYSAPFPTDHRASQRTSRTPRIAHHVQEKRVSSAPLASMVPDSMTSEDPSTQLGRAEGTRLSAITDSRNSGAYYDQLEVESLYASSSIYNGDTGGGPPSICSRPMSNFYGLSDYGDFEGDSYATPYNPNSLYSFSNTNRDSTNSSSNARRASLMPRHIRRSAIDKRPSQISRDPKTDTISHFINQYDDTEGTEIEGAKRPPVIQDACRAKKPAITHGAGVVPHFSAPLAPAFEYDEMPYSPPKASEGISGASSYGDTRYLLQIPTEESSAPANTIPAVALEPSSSYSQSEGMTKTSTPQAALDQAEKIFDEAESQSSIPPMWARRVSGSILQNRQSTIAEGTEDGDWETVGNNSRHSNTNESFADFSDVSDDMRVTEALYGDGPIPRDVSLGFFSYPSPLRTHDHPFGSSPPRLSDWDQHDSRATFGSSSPNDVSTVPLFQSTTRRYGEEPVTGLSGPGAVWSSPYTYELSDKVTQELLNSGPNEEILYEDELNSQLSGPSSEVNEDVTLSRDQQPTLSPFHDSYNNVVLDRDNSFSKLSELGPKGNLTGTPHGTGMHDAGSSIADNSSPGAEWSSSFSRKKGRPSGFAGFDIDYARSPGGDTVEALPSEKPARPLSMRSMKSTTSSRSHGHGRSAVPGQTKLRQMMLAPRPDGSHGRSSVDTAETHFDWFMRGGGSDLRPSTGNTDAPLRPISTQDGRALMAPSITHSMVHSITPHLRLPDHFAGPDPSLEPERKKWSWILFAMFCVLPPLLMLYRWYADRIIDCASRGRLGSASVTAKKYSLWIGAPLNILVVIAIVVPIMVSHAA